MFVPIETVIPGAAPSGTPAMPKISTFTLPLPGKALGTLNASGILNRTSRVRTEA